VRAFGDGPELLLLPMFLVTLAASVATLSRGGILVTTALVIALLGRFVFSRTSLFWKASITVSLVVVLSLAFHVFGEVLISRFRAAFSDNLSGRTEIYENSRRIASDFRWFGSGPGTFASVYYLYRQSPDEPWAAFVHDDWLETRVTFGRIGSALVMLQFAFFFGWVFSKRARWISRALTFCFFLSIFGCLVHAKVDFPFQTYGVAFTFVIVCALLSAAVVPEREREADTGSSQVGA
jgi:O-antigen ligase